MKSEKLIIQIIKDTGLSREEIFELIKDKIPLNQNNSLLNALYDIIDNFAISVEE